MATASIQLNLEGIDVNKKTVYMCVDNEKYARRPGHENIASVGLAVGLAKPDGGFHLITTARFSLAWTDVQVDYKTRTEYFNKYPGLLDKYLEWAYEAYEHATTEHPWAFLDLPGERSIDNPAYRDVVNRIQAYRIAQWIDHVQRELHKAGAVVFWLSDFCEFDVADLSSLVYDYRRQNALMYVATTNANGDPTYAWRGAAINADHQMGRFLPHNKTGGFGSDFFKKYGLTPVVNEYPHYPDMDAVAMLHEFVVADYKIDTMVDRTGPKEDPPAADEE